MNNNWEKDYPSVHELIEKELDENSSLKKMLRLIGQGKQVVDFGCATGYFSQLLTKKGCRVTGVEINADAAKVAEKYCERVIVADLDFVSVTEILPGQEFDVAVFGDVLEHLRNPWKVLEDIRQLLKPEGYVVASIPNIAHGTIRLALLQGRFEYMELGILDNTHLRFFTRNTVEELFERSGYFVDVIDRTKLPIFSTSPWVPFIDQKAFDSKVIQQIEQEEEVDTFQFVLRAFPLSSKVKHAVLKMYSELVEQLDQSQSQLQQTQAALEQSQSQLQQTQAALEQSQSQLQQTQTALEQSQSQLQQTQATLEQSQSQSQHIQTTFEQSQSQLQQTQAALEQSQSQSQHIQTTFEQSQSQLQEKQTELEQLQSQLQHTEIKLQQTQNTIASMKSSKFWTLRTMWFRLKKLFIWRSS